MNLTASNIKKTALAVFKRKQKVTQPRLVHPPRDWFIGMSIGVAILVGIMAWSGYMYISNRSSEQFQQNHEVAQPTVYRAAVVAEALEYFEDRQSRFAAVSDEALIVTPPEPTPPEAVSTSTDQLPEESGIDETATSTPEVPDQEVVVDNATGTPTISQ